MVVALGTLDPHPHEHLRDVFRHFQGVGLVLVVIRGGARERPPLGREEIAHHLVDRDIPLDLLLEPVVVEEHRLVADLLRRPDHEQLRPLHDPHLDKLFPLKERIDEMPPLSRIRAREERLELVAGGKRAADVEADSADELLVGAQLGGIDAELQELGVDKLVDVIVGRRIRPLEHEPLRQHDDV